MVEHVAGMAAQQEALPSLVILPTGIAQKQNLKEWNGIANGMLTLTQRTQIKGRTSAELARTNWEHKPFKIFALTWQEEQVLKPRKGRKSRSTPICRLETSIKSHTYLHGPCKAGELRHRRLGTVKATETHREIRGIWEGRVSAYVVGPRDAIDPNQKPDWKMGHFLCEEQRRTGPPKHHERRGGVRETIGDQPEVLSSILAWRSFSCGARCRRKKCRGDYRDPWRG